MEAPSITDRLDGGRLKYYLGLDSVYACMHVGNENFNAVGLALHVIPSEKNVSWNLIIWEWATCKRALCDVIRYNTVDKISQLYVKQGIMIDIKLQLVLVNNIPKFFIQIPLRVPTYQYGNNCFKILLIPFYNSNWYHNDIA